MTGPLPLANDDARDVRLAADGDGRAFERLYVRHAGRIRTVARRLLGESHADDGVQEVFTRAWSRLDTYRSESSFSTWLYRLGLNVLLRQIERGRRHDAAESIDMLELASPSTPDIGVRRDLDRALGTLTSGLREVVVLHDMEDHTHDEIAELLGITVSASKMRLHRARTALRQYMRGRSHD